ncbi:pentatricopeptide repeat-containing protein At3g48250, chloroplastic [Argentina anserina]|uniref:pentatricopeptide repeat-containing protein At3g48250, chloroplastic n=1 Tax=Argentina anserina TaxID=57926 RepID=UPI0021767D46|nr:pentatricopeptide repeat-containing protein At3g48250, chloroplastic [Potentilla anserina]
MNRAKAVLTSLRVANSLLLSRVRSTARPLCSQVTHFPRLLSNQSQSFHFLSTQQRLSFSSTPNSVLQLVLAKEWSAELETELAESQPSLTHDVVIYVLKKLYKDPPKAYSFFNWVCEKNGFSPSHSIFSLMLRVLVHRDTMRQFWVVLTKMKEQGFYIDVQTHLSILEQLKSGKMDAEVSAFKHFYERMVQDNAHDEVVKKVVDVVLGAEWSDKVEKELGELNVVLSDKFVVRVLRDLRVSPSKALRFFHWVKQCAGYEHSSVTYNGVALALGQASSIGEFWSVVEEMKVAGQELDLDTYIKLSRQFQKCMMIEDAVKLYEIMMDGPYKPSVQDVSVLLRRISANENPDLDLVFRVVKKFESAGFALSKAVYDGIHRSLTKAGRFDEAEKILKDMRDAGFEPDNITYSQAVFGLCMARKLEEACELLDDMEENGCVPDIMTWTILIQGHCAANEIDKALICFAKMMEKGCVADADLLDVLINGFIQQKKVDGAYNLLVEMLNTAHVRPWQATFKKLIDILLEAKRLEEAMELLRLMKKQGYPPYPEPFAPYISKFGSVEDALEFFQALSVKVYPSYGAYIHVLKSFFREGRHSEAKDLLYKCPLYIQKHGEVRKVFGPTARSKTTSTIPQKSKTALIASSLHQ